MNAGIIVYVMPDRGRNKRLYLQIGDGRTPRPRDFEFRTEPDGQTLPVVEHVLVPSEGAGQSTRTRLGIEDISQPHEHADRRIDRVARPQRRGHFERVANGQRHYRYSADTVKCFFPELQKPADSRILEDEQPAVSELAGKHSPRPFVKILRDRRCVPLGIERLPVVPGRAGGNKNRVVEICDLSGLPISHGIVGVGLHQRIRQIATQAGKNPCHGGGSAAVHAGNQHSYASDVS